jgi:Phage capsid family.
VTKSIPRGQFLVGNFQMAAAIWDRQSATVEISREHSDFFTRNLVAILTEERLALTVFRSDALVLGGFHLARDAK